MHNVLRFDMNKKVRRQNRVLMPLAWALSFPETFKRKLVIRRHNMEPLKKFLICFCVITMPSMTLKSRHEPFSHAAQHMLWRLMVLLIGKL